MARQSTLTLVIEAKNQAKRVLSGAQREVKGFADGMKRRFKGAFDSIRRSVLGLQDGLERSGATGTSALRDVGRQAGITSSQLAQVTESVNRIVESLRSDLAEGIARARLEMEKGLIDKDEFRDTARASVEAFEDELARLERRLDQTGVLPPEARRRIVNEFEGTGDRAVDGFIKEFAADADRAEEVLRDVGRKSGRGFGREVEKGAKVGLDDLEKFLRGGFIAGIVAALGFAAQRIVRFFGDVARRITEMLRKAGEIEGVERAFAALSSDAGLDAVELLDQLREGARGTASDFDLMRSAAEALQTGLRGTEDQFGELVDIGRRLAKTIGTDANEAFERLVRGVVRGRRQILDDIGILVDFDQAHQDFAAQLGVTVASLTEQQKAQARLNAVVERGREVVAALGPDILTTGEKVDQVATFVRNVTNASIAAFATTPRIREWLDAFADGSEQATKNMRSLELQIGATVDVIVNSFTTFEGFLRLIREFTRHPGTFGIGFAEQFGEAVLRRKQQQTLRDIRGISDLDELLTERGRILSEMRLVQQGRLDGIRSEEEASKRLLDLHEQLLTIAQQRRRLAIPRGGGGGGGDGIVGLSDEERAFIDRFIGERPLGPDVSEQPGAARRPGEGQPVRFDFPLQLPPNLDEVTSPEVDTSGLIEARTAWEEIGAAIQRATENQRVMEQVMAEMIAGVIRGFTNAIGQAFQAAAEGSQSAGEAFKSAMLGSLASIAEGFAQYFTAQAIGAVGAGLAGDPRQFAAAAKFTAAAAAMAALSGLLRGAASSGGGAGAGVSARAGQQADRAGEARQPPATVIIRGGLLNMNDPRQRREFSEALENLTSRRVIIEGA